MSNEKIIPQHAKPVPGDYTEVVLQDGRILKVGRAWPQITAKGIIYDEFLLVGHIDLETPEMKDGEVPPPHAERLVVRAILRADKLADPKHPYKRDGQFVTPTLECAFYPFVVSITSEESAEESAKEIDELRSEPGPEEAAP